MKKPDITIVIILILIIVILAFFSEYTDLSKTDVVSAVAIDKKGNGWTFTCEINMPSADNSFGSESIYVKENGYTLKSALDNLKATAPKKLYTDSVQLYLVNSDAASDDELLEYFNSDGINMRAITVMTKSDAENMLRSEKDDSSRAKAMPISSKIAEFAKDNGIPRPNVLLFMKKGSTVSLHENGRAEVETK